MSAKCLDAAGRIADRLCREAVWRGDSCGWRVSTRSRLSQPDDYAVGGANLYRGSAGIALFLAEMFKISGDPQLARCAIGGILHASGTRDRQLGIGFYSGLVGIHYAAQRVGRLTSHDELGKSAQFSIDDLRSLAASDATLDVIGGSAGAIPALLEMASSNEGGEFLDFASALARNLVRKAKRLPQGWAWDPPMGARRWLLGYSHGASGIGCALLELAAVTGDATFRYAGEQAFAYERHYFDSERNNWPDFRDLEVSEAQAEGKVELLIDRVRSGDPKINHPPRSIYQWCHGAPGIGLARLRAWKLFRHPLWLDEATVAVDSTLRSFAHGANINYSLCHGVAGNCETLLMGAEVLNRPELRNKVVDLLERGVDLFETSGRPWLSGALGGVPDPSLMMGEAGIGYMLARLGRNDIASILLIEPRTPQVPNSETYELDSFPLRHDDVRRHLGNTVSRLYGNAGATAALVPDGSLLRAPALRARQQLEEHISTIPNPVERERGLDAAALEFASMDMTLLGVDVAIEQTERLAHEDTEHVEWETGHWKLSHHARVVETLYDWENVDTSDSGPFFTLLRWTPTTIVKRRLSSFAGVVLAAVGSGPATFEQIATTIGDRVGNDDPTSMRRVVLQQLREAHRSGLVVRDWNVQVRAEQARLATVA